MNWKKVSAGSGALIFAISVVMATERPLVSPCGAGLFHHPEMLNEAVNLVLHNRGGRPKAVYIDLDSGPSAATFAQSMRTCLTAYRMSLSERSVRLLPVYGGTDRAHVHALGYVYSPEPSAVFHISEEAGGVVRVAYKLGGVPPEGSAPWIWSARSRPSE